MALNLLTDKKIRNATFPDVKSLNDGQGLSVQLSKSAKRFRFRYTRPTTKKINNIILGEYPSLTLKSARKIAQGFREMVTRGIDPGNQHQEKHTFADIANKYFEKHRHEWSEKHYKTSFGRYKNYLYKPLGNKPASDITTYDIYQILESVAQSGSYQTAEKLSYIINGCMTQAAVLGLIPVNPAVGVMSQVSKTTKSEQMPHFNLTKNEDKCRFSKFLNDIEHIKQSSIVVKTALLLSPHLFMRSGSLVTLKVSDFDKENKLLVVPAENMKSKHSDFIVPLSNQAFELLDNLLTVTNPDVYIFESRQSKTGFISREAISSAKKRAGWKFEDVTIHGLRHTATTYLTEQGFDYEVTELQLHHKLQGVRGIYNKAVHLEERRRMMQVWSDYIDKLKN